MPSIEEMDNVSRTVLCCPHCRQENLPQWKFCAQCGAALWEPCLQCGESCAAGESFCGECGACLSDVAAEHVERIEADLRAAAEMSSAFRFEEAIALLTRVRKNDHPRLAEHAAQAKELIGRLAVERRQRLTAAEQACQLARQCLAGFDFDGAAESIESVPPALENDDVRQLRDEIAKRRQELNSLAEELRDAVREKRLLELPSRIERLLAVKPDHAYARKVAGQVQKQLVGAARRLLAEHRYEEASRLLDQSSAWAEASDFQEIRQEAAELAWLDWDLRHAPIVDGTLAAVAERLRRLAPDDAGAAKLSDEIERRVKHAAKTPQKPLQWVRPPEQTPLGIPVEWLTGFRRIEYAEAFDRSPLLNNPGRFAVACGLGLAGVEQSALAINLLSGRRQGLLHRVKRLVRHQAASAWGIDLGASSLKAVKLRWNEAKQQAVIEDVALIEHAKALHHAVNEAEEGKLLTETLKTFFDAHEIKADRVCVGVPGRMTISRRIDLPPIDRAKASKLVAYEAPSRFPFPLDQLAWDFEILGDASAGGGHALLIAAKSNTVRHYLDAFESFDVRVDVLQPDFVALRDFLAYEEFSASADPSQAEKPSAVAALDIGCDATNLVVSSPDSLWFRGCGVAGHSFTRALVKEFNLTLAQAEDRKRSPETADRFSDFCEALSPVLDDLLDEVRQSLEAYAESHPDRPVERLVGLGGGFLLHGVFRHLRCGR